MRLELESLLNSLNENKYIEIETSHIGRGADPIRVEIATKGIHFTLPNVVLKFYESVSSFEVKWECDLRKHNDIERFHKEDEFIRGEISIRGIGKLVNWNKKLSPEYWKGDFLEEELEDLNNFRSFESYQDYFWIGFLIENGSLSEGLYSLSTGDEGFVPCPFGFEEYIKKMCEYKGISGWKSQVIFDLDHNGSKVEHYLHQIFGINL